MPCRARAGLPVRRHRRGRSRSLPHGPGWILGAPVAGCLGGPSSVCAMVTTIASGQAEQLPSGTGDTRDRLNNQKVEGVRRWLCGWSAGLVSVVQHAGSGAPNKCRGPLVPRLRARDAGLANPGSLWRHLGAGPALLTLYSRSLVYGFFHFALLLLIPYHMYSIAAAGVYCCLP